MRQYLSLVTLKHFASLLNNILNLIKSLKTEKSALQSRKNDERISGTETSRASTKRKHLFPARSQKQTAHTLHSNRAKFRVYMLITRPCMYIYPQQWRRASCSLRFHPSKHAKFTALAIITAAATQKAQGKGARSCVASNMAAPRHKKLAMR
jgi:hypothetical protein